jgi:curved DNA-binding protein CbpA
MDKLNYYRILGMATNASQEEIRKSYLKLARRYHPDRRPGDKEAAGKFARIAEAYRVLSNVDSRYVYDLELGIEPGREVSATIFHRIEEAPVTGDEAGDYLEEIAGGIPLPRMKRTKRKEEFKFKGLDHPRMHQAYKKGVFSIGSLEKADRHQLYEKGMEFLRGKEFERAVAYLKEALSLGPGNMQYHFGLGCAYEAGDKLPEAIREYEEALKLGRQEKFVCRPLREALISLYMQTGDFAKAGESCKELLRFGIVSTVAEQVLTKLHRMRSE